MTVAVHLVNENALGKYISRNVKYKLRLFRRLYPEREIERARNLFIYIHYRISELYYATCTSTMAARGRSWLEK